MLVGDRRSMLVGKQTTPGALKINQPSILFDWIKVAKLGKLRKNIRRQNVYYVPALNVHYSFTEATVVNKNNARQLVSRLFFSL